MTGTAGMPADRGSKPQPALRRRLSLPLVALYGLGTTIGAGVYVLIGKVAGAAGMFAPLSFILACAIAGLTAFSFAELSSRIPRSAGEALYVFHGLKSRHAALAVGLLVAFAGIVSSGTITAGFVGYFRHFVDAPAWLVILCLAALLGAVAAWGIAESVIIAAVLTVVEIGGLLAVIVGGSDVLAAAPERMDDLLPPLSAVAWLGIVSGAVLAFYAFLGFEDIVNVVEEVKNPTRTVPIAILVTLVATLVLYVLLAAVAVLALPVDRLAGSDAPLAELFRHTTGASPALIALVSMVAVVNGALIQIIMASRVLYGLASQGWLPGALASINRVTRTPLTATGLVAALVLVFALALPLTTLAEITALATLIIFASINLALIAIKRREPPAPGHYVVARWLPYAGLVVSGTFALYQIAVFAIRAANA